MNKKDYKLVVILLVVVCGIIFVLTEGNYLYGSVTDWVTQHYRIPEYFRNLFYETHDLFPDFAFHLGAGQNIYYLSYYGLLSPIILLSYLFPFISMQNYIIITTIILLLISIFLFYKWIRKKNDTRMSFILTCLFSFATPLLFHSHRHIMFMNYMPFLLMSLFGVDAYFEKNKKTLLMIGIFLMIMTSYFFSVSGIVAVCIYSIMRYIEVTPKRNIKTYIKDGFKFLCPIVIAILMSSILLLPTLYTILDGRVEGSDVNLFDLVVPNFDITNILYGAYSFGLTAILLLAIIVGIKEKQKPIKFLSIVLLIIICFPLFLYILNGGMYINGKVLIPFLPLAIICVANTLKNEKIDKNHCILFGLISLVIIWCNRNQKVALLFAIDVAVTLLAIIIQNKIKIKYILSICTILITIAISVSTNKTDELTPSEPYVYENILNYIKEDTSIYRTNNLYNNLHSINQVLGDTFYTTSIYSSTSNPYYKNFYKNDIHNEFRYRSREILGTTKNILSNIYLGNKYIIADSYKGAGYEKVYTDKINVYKNENVFSIGYATNKIMSRREFETLEYPYNIDALLHYTIIDTSIENVYVPNISKIELDFDITKSKVKYEKQGNGYYIVSKENGSKMYLDIKNKELLTDKILLIRYKINNISNIDRTIKINDIINKVTKEGWKYHNENYSFEYTLSENNLTSLELIFSKGEFNLQDFEFYILDTQDLLSLQNTHDAYIIKTVNGDIIEGTIDVKENSYFSISIPYDTGFDIYIDNNKINYEKVNNNFIGFPISKGDHTIRFVYKAPWSTTGKILSILGFTIFIVTIIVKRR